MPDRIVIEGGSFCGQNIFAPVQGSVHNTVQHEGLPPSEEPARPGDPAGSVVVHVALDVVGYRTRDSDGQALVQERIRDALLDMLAAVGITRDSALWQNTGDGANLILPASFRLSQMELLLESLQENLRRGNCTYRDQLSVRLALGIGPTSETALGFKGRTIISLSDVLNSTELRNKARASGTLIALGISSPLHRFVVEEGGLRSVARLLVPVTVQHKDGRTEDLWMASLP